MYQYKRKVLLQALQAWLRIIKGPYHVDVCSVWRVDADWARQAGTDGTKASGWGKSGLPLRQAQLQWHTGLTFLELTTAFCHFTTSPLYGQEKQLAQDEKLTLYS